MKISLFNIFASIAAFASVGHTASAWSLIFDDQFSDNRMDERWHRVDYHAGNAPDWRKYQSTDAELVSFGQDADGTEYVRLSGRYGDYTSQNDQQGLNDTYACGGIFTNGTFTFQYGYVEVRARFDSVQGCWPAIWMMPTNGGNWPANGEIDILEHLNSEAKIYQTLHFNGNNGGNVAPGVQPGLSNQNAWHTYGMEWKENSISFYLDGVKTRTFTGNEYANWPFGREGNEFYLMIDQQIGGSWVEGSRGIDQNKLATDGANFDIDYVKVWSAATDTSPRECGGWNGAPTTAAGELIDYIPSGRMSGTVEPPELGDYHYTVQGTLSGLKAQGSNIRLEAEGAASIASADIEAESLWLSKGRFESRNSTFETPTLYLAGGSLSVEGPPVALAGVDALMLGYSADETGAAERNAALFVKSDQTLAAQTILVDDSKIAVKAGATLSLQGNIRAENNTLYLAGHSAGTATIQFEGDENRIKRLAIGIAEQNDAGRNFAGPGYTVNLQLLSGSETTISVLSANSPHETKSSLDVQAGAVLTVRETITSTSTAHFNLNVQSGGALRIGAEDGSSFQTSQTPDSLIITNKGMMTIARNASLNINTMSVSATGSAANANATLNILGTLNVNTLHMSGKEWKPNNEAYGVLNIENADRVSIGSLVDDGGQTRINVNQGTLALALLANNGGLTLNTTWDSEGTIRVSGQATLNQLTIHHGSLELNGGVLSGNTSSSIIKAEGSSTLLIHGGDLGENTVRGRFSVSQDATLQTAGKVVFDAANAASPTLTGKGTLEVLGGTTTMNRDLGDNMLQRLVVKQGELVLRNHGTSSHSAYEGTITVDQTGKVTADSLHSQALGGEGMRLINNGQVDVRSASDAGETLRINHMSGTGLLSSYTDTDVRTAADFTGALRAVVGILTDEGEATAYTSLETAGGELILTGKGQGITTLSLTIGDGGAVSVFRGAAVADPSTEAEATVSLGNAAKRGVASLGAGAHLNANLVLANTDLRIASGGVSLGSSLTLGKGNTLQLSEADQAALAVGTGSRIVLATGVDSFLLADGETVQSYTQSIAAAPYFTNLADQGMWLYSLAYDLQTEGGTVYIASRLIPEPTTTTLSLLALTALCARRKRTHA